MDDNHRIDEMIAAGEKHKATIELVRNWCRHARLKRTVGRGLIQMQTGLPIGHHSMGCEHAVASGHRRLGTWHIALDFHNRNCVSRTHR